MTNWKKIYEALDAIPEGKRRLAKGHAWSNRFGCGCALGSITNANDHPPDGDSFAHYLSRPSVAAYGLTYFTARWVERINDGHPGPPDRRFTAVLAAIKEKMETADET